MSRTRRKDWGFYKEWILRLVGFTEIEVSKKRFPSGLEVKNRKSRIGSTIG